MRYRCLYIRRIGVLQQEPWKRGFVDQQHIGISPRKGIFTFVEGICRIQEIWLAFNHLLRLEASRFVSSLVTYNPFHDVKLRMFL